MRKLAVIGGLVSALSLTPAHVAAETTRTERFIVGAVALAIIGAALHNNQRRGTVEVQPQRYAPRGLPAACLRSYQTYRGEVRLFSGNCLEHRYPAYHSLPLACAVTIRDGGRYESGFRPRCLREAGYSLAGS